MRARKPLIAAPLVGVAGRKDAGATPGVPTLLTALCALCAALLLAPFSTSAQAATCANEAIRAEQGSAALALPDCRAYEFASPGSNPSLTKDSTVGFGGGKASPEGNALSYFSRYPASGSLTSSETWLSRRTASGWTVRSLDPQMTPAPTENGICQPGVALSEALDAFLLSAGGDLESIEAEASGECGSPAQELASGEPRGYSNLYLRRGDGPYELVNPAPAGVPPANATFQAASSDLSHVVFSEDAELASGSIPGSDLFMWADGTVRAIGILPNGQHVPAKLGAAAREWGAGELSGPLLGLAPVSHAVSADGERVFFEANGNLYLRENAGQAPAAVADCRTTSQPDLACTLQVDRAIPGAGSDGGGVFQFASRDGDRVFFISDHKLTFPASATAGKPDLYEFDVSARKLANLTAVGQSAAANVRGFSGGSDDGSHVYFVARGVLTGSDPNSEGDVALENEPNLYLVHDRELTYIATLSPWKGVPNGGIDQYNWWETAENGAEFGVLKTAWSPSGNYFLFSSHEPLTDVDNTPAQPGLCGGGPSCKQLFLYDVEAEELSCVSCDPGGGKPVAHTGVEDRAEFLRFAYGPRYAPRHVQDSGQVFFETQNPLSARDVNGFQDVYEYRSGALNLISSGTATGGSAFVDASADARDVFFVTSEALVRADRDGLPSIYDARAGGGFAEPPLPPGPCVSEDSCRTGFGPPPAVAPPATTAATGQGNVRPRRHCKRGKVRRGGRCVKKANRQNKQRSARHRSERKN